MTIAETLKKYTDVESDLLLSHVLNKTKEFLYLHPEKKLTELQCKKFIWLANQRRHGVPVAYLLGYKFFYGLKFKVNRDVLIPRPETEWLVDKSMQILTAKLKRPNITKLKVLDLATGSGCIGISIAKHTKNRQVSVFASDVSEKALTVARSNNRLHKTKIKFYHSDLLKDVPSQYDLIIANLPYVPFSDYKKFHSNLKFEPKTALTDGGEDFKLIKKFLKQVPSSLAKGGVILLEVDPKFFKSKEAKGWRVVKDLSGLKRFALMYASVLAPRSIKS